MVARYGEIEPAWACTGRLRANGISPILLTDDDLETDARRFLVRSFELGSQAITATSRRGDTTGTSTSSCAGCGWTNGRS